MRVKENWTLLLQQKLVPHDVYAQLKQMGPDSYKTEDKLRKLEAKA